MMIISRRFIGEETWELSHDQEDGSYMIDYYSGNGVHYDSELLGYDLREAELEFESICDEEEEYLICHTQDDDYDDDEDYYEPYDGLTENEIRYNN